MNTRIIVATEFFASHAWTTAPDHRAYLRCQHFHAFRVRFEAVVSHEERELEFHDVRERLDAVIRGLLRDNSETPRWSCETWARNIMEAMGSMCGCDTACEVWEDHAHGARVEAFR